MSNGTRQLIIFDSGQKLCYNSLHLFVHFYEKK